MESSEEIVTQIKKTSQSVFTELAILIALKKIGEKKGLTLLQQSDFHTPWGKVPDSEEEEAHQDLVWIHKVLPPNDKFDLVKAQEGFYKIYDMTQEVIERIKVFKFSSLNRKKDQLDSLFQLPDADRD